MTRMVGEAVYSAHFMHYLLIVLVFPKYQNEQFPIQSLIQKSVIVHCSALFTSILHKEFLCKIKWVRYALLCLIVLTPFIFRSVLSASWFIFFLFFLKAVADTTQGISSAGSKVRERVRRTVLRTIGKLVWPAWLRWMALTVGLSYPVPPVACMRYLYNYSSILNEPRCHQRNTDDWSAVRAHHLGTGAWIESTVTR